MAPKLALRVDPTVELLTDPVTVSGPGATTSTKPFDTVPPAESATEMVKLNWPAVVGVPPNPPVRIQQPWRGRAGEREGVWRSAAGGREAHSVDRPHGGWQKRRSGRDGQRHRALVTVSVYAVEAVCPLLSVTVMDRL